MATSNKKTNNSKKQTSSSAHRNQGKNRKPAEKSGVAREAVILIVIALSVIFFIANFGVGGTVGAAISSFFFGIMGVMAYVFPIILVIATLFYISNKNNSVARVKLIAAAFLMLFICVVIQLVCGSHYDEWSVGQYYTECSANKSGGGFFGGNLARLFVKWFGKGGACIFDIVLIIICFVVLTGRSFLEWIGNGSRKVYDTAKEDVEQYREEAQVKREKREKTKLTRAEKKAYGVTFDTEIKEETGAESPDNDKPFNFEPAPEESKRDETEIPFFNMDNMSSVKQNMEPVDNSYMEPEDAFHSSPVIDTDLVRQELEKAEKERCDNDDAAEVASGFEAQLPKKTESKSAGTPAKKPKKYVFPPLNLLKRSEKASKGRDKNELRDTAIKLQQTLASFGVKASVTSYSCGPSVTRYELQPEIGVRVSKIVSLADDIKLNLAAADIRIEAPIPGKSAVGIEVPNKINDPVLLGDMIATSEFKNEKSLISFAIGKDVAGKNIMADIAKMPHVLVAGTTGSGKSVCLNAMILSILYRARPDEVKLILVDPKMVEFTAYNGIPHLLTPVVTDPKKAASALNWAVVEMDKRYQLFSQVGAKDIEGYNEKIDSLPDDVENKPEKMFKIVIIMDELADLMMTSGKEAETAIVRLAQKARACGIHLVLATQKPTVDVVTGLIKSNVPSRLALTVASQMDSRVMLDENGAEKLLGYGDMLYLPSGKAKPDRLQGPYVSEAEIEAVVSFIKEHSEETSYSEEVKETLENPLFEESQAFSGERDQYFAEAGKLIIEKQRASIGMLQRIYRIGFNRAARIMDQLCEAGVVGPEEGTKPRKVLMTMEEFNQYINNNAQ